MKASPEAYARQTRYRLWLALFIRDSLKGLSWALFASGTVILALRFATVRWTLAYSLWLCAGLVAVALSTACLLSWRQLPNWRQLVVWLDEQFHAGGLMIATLQEDMQDWQSHLPQIPPRHFRIQLERLLPPLLLSVAFAVGAQLMPISHLSAIQPRKLDIKEPVEQMEQQLELLKEESLIAEQTVSELRDSLDDLNQHNDARDPAKTYELMDTLAKRLNYAGEGAYTELEQQAENRSNLSEVLQKLAEMQAESPNGLDANLLNELHNLMDELSMSDSDLAKLLESTLNSPKGAQLSTEAMKKLAEALKKAGKEKRTIMAKLVEAKLCNNCQSPSGGEDGETAAISGEDLESWLENHSPDSAAMLAVCCGKAGESPTSGTPDRGPGVAPLDFSGKTEDFKGQFKEQKLDALASPQNSELIKTEAVAPDIKESDREAAQGGNLSQDKSKLKRQAAPVHPQHKQAVKKYFQP